MQTTSASAIASNNLISAFDFMMPEVRNKFFRIRNGQGMYAFNLLENLGMVEGISRNDWTQYEEDWIHPTIHVGAGGLTAVDIPNGIYTFVLGNSGVNNDFLAGSILPPYPSSPTPYYCPIELYNRLRFPAPNNNYMATVTNLSGVGTNTVTVTIKLTNLSTASAFAIGASIPAGTELFITGNSYADGTDQPRGLVHKPLTDTGVMQIIKTNFGINGSQSTDQLWVKEYSDGTTIQGYRVIGQQNMEYEHAYKIDKALLFEEPTTNPVIDPISGEPCLTTEGIDTYIRRKGTSLPLTAGSFGVPTLDTMEKIVDAQAPGTQYYMCMDGISIDQDKDNALKQYFNFTDIEYVQKMVADQLFGGDEAMQAQVGFRVFKKGYTTWCWSRMPQFSDVRGMGIAGYGGQNLMLCTPIGKKKDERDSSKNIPYFGMYYKELGGYSRKAEVVNLMGATNGAHVTGRDLNQFGLKSHIGACHVGGNAMIRLYLA